MPPLQKLLYASLTANILTSSFLVYTVSTLYRAREDQSQFLSVLYRQLENDATKNARLRTLALQQHYEQFIASLDAQQQAATRSHAALVGALESARWSLRDENRGLVREVHDIRDRLGKVEAAMARPITVTKDELESLDRRMDRLERRTNGLKLKVD